MWSSPLLPWRYLSSPPLAVLLVRLALGDCFYVHCLSLVGCPIFDA